MKKKTQLESHSVGELKATYITTGPRYDAEPLSNGAIAADITRKIIGTDINYREHVVALLMDNANILIGHVIVSVGGLDGAEVDLRLLFQHVLLFNAKSIIMAHNHPSDRTNPSDADIKLTGKIKKVAELLKIRVLDHIIVTEGAYCSMAQEGLL